MFGSIQVLSSRGDDKLELPESLTEAKIKVDELLAKGYKIFVTVSTGEGDAAKKDTLPVKAYDPDTGEYVIGTKKEDRRILAATAEATAIAPVAGG